MATLLAKPTIPLMAKTKKRPQFNLGLAPRTVEPFHVLGVTPVSVSGSALFPSSLEAQTIVTSQTQQQQLPFTASLVAPRLYVGCALDAARPEPLLQRGIRYVLNLAAECPMPAALTAAGIECLHIPLQDVSESETEALRRFPEICHFIQTGLASGAAVLVHCFLGLSRGPTAAISYLIVQATAAGGDMDASDVLYGCLRRVQDVREGVLPNYGFMEALRVWSEQQLMATPRLLRPSLQSSLSSGSETGDDCGEPMLRDSTVAYGGLEPTCSQQARALQQMAVKLDRKLVEVQ
jgi:predicted protein tyrosine phosphatase